MKRFSYFFQVLLSWVFISTAILPQWSSDPTVNNPVAVSSSEKTQPMLTGNGAGGTIITWLQPGAHPGEDNIYAQNLDAAGNKLWPVGGVLVTPPSSNYSRQLLKIFSDGKNGAIITWYQVNSPGLTRTFKSQRINSAGTVLWGTGVDIAVPLPGAFFLAADVAPDGNAGLVACWTLSAQNAGTNLWVYAQKIDSNGATVWAAPGGVSVTVNLQTTGENGYPVIAGDGSGGAFMAWEDSRNPTGVAIYSQYIINAGTVIWNPGGMRATPNSPAFTECRPKIVCRSQPSLTGPIIAWKGTWSGSTNIYAQQLFFTNGFTMWPTPHLHTLIQNNAEDIAISDISTTGVAVSWIDAIILGSRVFVKAIDAGTQVWGTNPILLSSNGGILSNQKMTATGPAYGGALLTWQAAQVGGANIYAQYIDQTGAVRWSSEGYPVSLANGDQTNPQLISDGTTSAFVTWKDFRSGSNNDVYAARIPLFGVPVLSSPANASGSISVSPLFKWFSVQGAAEYDFQLSTDPGFATVLYSSTVTDTMLNFPNVLNNSTVYYWRVAAAGASFSAANSFTTIAPAVALLNYPINNATVYTLTPTLGWNLTFYYPGIKFDVKISSDSLFSPGSTTTIFADSALQITTGTLLPATHYYWMVVSKTASGGIISYSARQDFTTYGTLVSATPSWPVGGATVYSNNPVLYWYMGTAAYSYTFRVRYKETSSVVWSAPINAGGNLSLQLLGLTPGTAYDWEVQSYNGTAYSSWSSTQHFVTYNSGSNTPPLPVLSYPTSGVTVYSLSPFLYWYIGASSAGIDYTIEVSDARDFTTGLQNFSSVTNLYIQTSSLNAGRMYYWRVKSYNGSSYSSWSAPDSFYTYNISGNIQPVLTYPTGGATVYTSTPSLYWYTLGGTAGTTYEIQYAVNSPSFGPIITSTTTFCTLPALQYGQKYFWRVRSLQGIVTSNWSPIDSFEVTGRAGSLTPMLTWPVGGALSSVNPMLFWYVNSYVPGMTFTVEYADNEFFTGATTATTSDYFLSLSGLNTGTIYYWRVKTYNGNSFSPYSQTATFTTTAGVNPSMPVAGSPTGGVVINTNRPVFSWFLPVPSGNTSYELQYSNSPEFESPVTVSNLTSPVFTPAGLNYSVPVFWRVRSKSPEGIYSPYSAVERFIPAMPLTAGNNTAVPGSFILNQNYPNPFNPSTVISYSLPAAGYLSLKVYGINGEEITELFKGYREAGNYTASFNANGIGSGVYLYRAVFTSSEGTKTLSKKMNILK